MNINLRVLDAGCGVLVAAVLLSSAAVVALNGARTTERLRAERQQVARQNAELRRVDENLRQAQIVLEEARRSMRSLDEQVPEAGQIGEFLSQIDTRAKRRLVSLVDLEPLPAVREEPYARVPVRLVCVGRFGNLHMLIHDIESMGRLVRMDRLVMTRSPGAAECRMELAASLFER